MTTSVAEAAPARRLSALADEDLGLLLLIRHFELKLLDLFAEGGLSGTTHTCLGQEYVPVAVSPLLDLRDFVFSNHRGHGHYLARYRDPHGLLAEIMGRRGALCNGVGGSQHLLRDSYLSSGVQGQSLPVATGVALALKRSESGRLVCAYIGDGTWGEGAVYEALNMAALWCLPLVVVVEHNGIAQSTPTERQLAGTIADRARAFGIRHHRTESADVNEIRAQLSPLLECVRRDSTPLVVEFATHRLGAHSKGDDARPQHAIDEAREQDWYARYAAQSSVRFTRLDAEMRTHIDEVAAEVAARPPAAWERR